ncbi:ARM repeat-containing protein [Microthyrium microscopicum]|uniref:ARM repeat-containing protein n=1 Tax=Microthyrium microscopicum TaxID=703497 RepID=A0A6A6U9M9_9PEZI|nr:ARM repeat-containing protein [Microthyrium microscopicum]
MDEQAQNLLATLKKSSVAIDTKLAAFNNLKSSIKHQRVPDSAQPVIFESIRLGISAQTSPTLVSTAFSTVAHLIKRLALQEQTSVIAAWSPKLLPILLDRLGDARESTRNAASQTLCDLWPYSKNDVERMIKEGALAGNNARSKEMAMMWVVKMHNSDGLPFRGFVPSLVACLEDSDGGVRETAKSVVVELFGNAPEHAKVDLKKQMASRDVRKAIVAFVVQHLGMRNTVELDLGASIMSAPAGDHGHVDSTMNESIMSEAPVAQDSSIDPLYIHTQRELEDAFRDMQPPFEGRESEHNWLARDKSIKKIRRLLKGNALEEFHAAFVAGIKGMMDGILKAANTLRTTMSTNACQLVQELYRTLGTTMDPMTEIMIQNFIKMSSNTKQLAAKNADTTMEAILSHASYNQRMMNHLWLTFQEKNMQTRAFGPSWLKIVIRRNASHKAQIEHSGGMDVILKCLKKGLEDANPKVRESTRSAYWVFAQVWPDQGEKFMNSLEDSKMRTALEKDANNPNKSSMASSFSSVASTKSRPAPTARPSIRDAIAAQRKAALGKNLPDRPNSALAAFPSTEASGAGRGPIRPAGARSHTVAPSKLADTPSTKSTLTAAPVRRPRKPEIARPATADPYASRRGGQTTQTTPTISPQTSPSKIGSVAKPTAASAARTIGRTPARGGAMTPAIRGKARAQTVSRPSPTHGRTNSVPVSPEKDETLTLVTPFNPPDDFSSHSVPLHQSHIPHLRTRDSGATVASEDDTGGFTMVIPNLRPESRDKSSPRPSSSGTPYKSGLPRRTPMKAENVKPGSPLVQRIDAQRKTHSPDRSRLVDSAETEAGAVQIYEDPFQADETDVAPAGPFKPVLGEIALNERSSDVEREQVDLAQSTRSNEQNVEETRTPRGHMKTTSTGSILGPNGDAAEAAKNKRLLNSAIERVRGKNLDAHGFRRVQDIVKTNQDIWGEDAHKFGDLLVALLEYLEAPADSLKISGTPSSSKVQNLKTQVLATIRGMLAMHRKEAAPFYSQSLCSVLTARRQFDDMSHITSEMEKLADDIARNGQPTECISAVIDLIDSLALSASLSPPTSPTVSSSPSSPRPSSAGNQGENMARTVTMALNSLASLLAAASTRKVPISPDQTKRLGSLAVRLLQDTDPEVRRADLEFCLALHERLGGENGEGFWKAVEGAKESGLNLITYYLARRGKA